MTIEFHQNVLSGSVQLPISKSMYHRALMIQALRNKNIHIENDATSNDSILLNKAFRKVQNCDDELIEIDVEDAGTPFRFFAAYLSLQLNRKFILTGNEGLCQRPIADLVTALIELGADIQYLKKVGFPPIKIHGKKLIGKEIAILGNVSSQFISALCLIAPCIQDGILLRIHKPVVSSKYIDMTLSMMYQAQIQFDKIETDSTLCIKIVQQEYLLGNLSIEHDWSAATFIYCMAMLQTEVNIQIENLILESIQGDVFIATIAQDFGIQTIELGSNLILQRVAPINSDFKKHYELSDYPDLAIPLIVACAIQYPFVTFSGLHHLELKESKRLSALTLELKKLNIELMYKNDHLSFLQKEKTQQHKVIAFEHYNDHRIVMALSLLALHGIQVEFEHVACIQKSFPKFFNEIEKLGFKVNS